MGKKEIDKFERAERAFFQKNPGKEWTYLEFATGQMVHGIEFTARPTETMEKAAHFAVIGLRNTLDQGVYAATRALGSTSPKYTGFPVAETKKELERRILAPKGQYRDIPAKLHAKLVGIWAFRTENEKPDGNPLLRALTEMANPNKHHLPLGIECQTGMRLYGMRGGIISVGTRWNWEGRTELYRTVPGVPFEFDMQLEPRIAFGKVAGMAGKPVTSTLREMHAMVAEIIIQLEGEAKRLL